MSKIENKKGKKRPFGETQSAKLWQKQENVSGFKKDFKKPKLAISTQNGDFKAENKAKSFKVTDKQKQHKNAKQSVNTMPSHLKGKVGTAQSKEISFKTKEKKIDGSKKTKLPKEKQQQQQQQSPSQNKSPKKEYTIEHLEQRIKEIEERENLSKTAKRKLSFYKKLLVKKTEGKELEKSVTEKKNIQTSKNVQLNKQKVNDKSKAKPKPLIKPKHKAEEKEEDEDDDNDDDDDDDDDEDTDDYFDDDDNSDAGLSDLEEEEEDGAEEGEEEEEEEEGEEEEGEGEEEGGEDSEEDKEFEEVDEEEENGESEDELMKMNLVHDDEDESDEMSEENDEEDDEIDTDDESDEMTKVIMQSPKKKEDSFKKNQYSLFVKNLPNDAMENDIKQHFLKTVSKVISVTKNKNFAIVELANKTEYEKGLLLNQTKFKGKMMSVQQYIPKKPIPIKRTDDPKSGKHPKDKTTPRVELKQNKKLQQKKGKNNY